MRWKGPIGTAVMSGGVREVPGVDAAHPHHLQAVDHLDIDPDVLVVGIVDPNHMRAPNSIPDRKK